jgi:Fic family protein
LGRQFANSFGRVRALEAELDSSVTDGNGRTARALSYLLLCARLGYRLPGTNTIPEQISKDKTPYYKALEAADKEWAENKKVDLSVLEKLLGDLLANQLVSVHDQATSGKPHRT